MATLRCPPVDTHGCVLDTLTPPEFQCLQVAGWTRSGHDITCVQGPAGMLCV